MRKLLLKGFINSLSEVVNAESETKNDDGKVTLFTSIGLVHGNVDNEFTSVLYQNANLPIIHDDIIALTDVRITQLNGNVIQRKSIVLSMDAVLAVGVSREENL